MLKTTCFLLLTTSILTLGANVNFFCYQSGSDTPVKIDQDSIFDCIDPSALTKIIIHGWTHNGTLPWIVEIARFFHEKGPKNVISLDWSEDANEDYLSSASATEPVGYLTGDFVLKIAEEVEDFLENLHLIGHSLGAHVAGFAGQRVQKKSGGRKIARLTGLDAAGPLFYQNPFTAADEQLDETDASFVDLIHTQGFVGAILAYGDADFYVNSAMDQLNCTEELLNVVNFAACNHHASINYYGRSIVEPEIYKALACEDPVSFNSGLCDRNEWVYMGEQVDLNASGTYFINIDDDGNRIKP